METRPRNEHRDIDAEIELRMQANPAYRDTPLGRGESGPFSDVHTRRRSIPRRADRPLMWRLLGVPAPRELVRALLIDGYPRSLHRWAFDRVGSAIGWTCAAGGVLAAALGLWFVTEAGFSHRTALAALLGLSLAFILVALARFLPILSAIRYATRWDEGMRRSRRSWAARR